MLARTAQYQPRLDRVLILVVEDHADSRELLHRFLESVGAQVLPARDGIEAMGILEAHTPDIVLSDIRMPRMDGVQLAQRVKNDPRWARIPMIAVTAYNTAADLRQTFEAGFDGHLEKPFNFDVLLTT